jgi:glycyl-tRNA synthetase
MSRKDITSYLKDHGFLIPNAEIYGGLAKAWDLGPLGVELKRNLKNLWWKYFVTTSPYNVGCDSLIITHPRVLSASGHQKNFHDWLVECKTCQKRYRLDNLINEEEFNFFLQREKKEDYLVQAKCSYCQKNSFSSPRKFNLLLTTNLEITENKENLVYLRPETCQGIFTNFATIQRTTHRKFPFGIGQVGKSFRNEITLRHGIFRTREFEQMELEFFCPPIESEKWWNYWTEKAWNFLQKTINDQENIKQVELNPDELPHYAKKTLDLYFNYHFGWGELCSNSHRGDYDLSQHSKFSQRKLSLDGIIPEVIEISFGVERQMLAILEDAYKEEITEKSVQPREILKLCPLLSPYFAVIIPLNKKKLHTATYQLYCELLKEVDFNLTYEATDKIGDSYRRQDAIGTYYCLTFDFDSEKDQAVTIRQRDTRKQERMPILSVVEYLNQEYRKYWKILLN